MDKRKSLTNVVVALTLKVILLVSSILVKRYVILYIGNDLNGLNALYLSIINVLAVTELGVGDAIVFCMYQPIAEGTVEKTASLYVLLKKIYMLVGIVIAAAGCFCMLFLPYLARGYAEIEVNLYQTFGLMLISVVLTYFFSAKTSLMNAYRDNYITTAITSGGQLLQQCLQILVLYKTKSYTYFLMCRIVAVSAQWCVTEIVMRRKYAFIVKVNHPYIDENTRKIVIKNAKAMFMHRIGTVLVNTLDSIVISSFIGLTMLGKYSNYVGIVTAMFGLLMLFFSPLTSTIGQLFVVDKKASKQYYHFFCAINFLLSFILVKVCQAYANDEIAVLGVLIATIMTNIFICHLVEPYVLYKHAFHMPVFKHYIQNYGRILLFAVLLSALNVCLVSMENKKMEFFINGCISLCFSIIPIVVVTVEDKDFRYYMKRIGLRLYGKNRK